MRKNHIYFLIKLATLSILFLISGCSSMFGEHGVFRGKSKDYLDTGAISSITVPAELQGGNISQLYVIPEVSPRDEFGDPIVLGEYKVPRPDPINVEKGNVGVKLQSLGEKKWIFLNASTSQVWPRTQNFLSEYGLSVAYSNPSKGIIETSDVVFKENPDTRSRYRIYIEKGIHPETTEIHVVHVEFPAQQGLSSQFSWPSVSHNVEHERTLLNELAAVLAKSVNNNSASLLGQNVGGDLKVEFVKESKEARMRLYLDPDRAKATVAHALNRGGFMLWEESETSDLFYVGYDPDRDDSPGFFSRLFRGGSGKAPHTMNTVLQHLSNTSDVKTLFSNTSGVGFNDPLPEASGLLVKLNSSKKGVTVIVRDVRGERLANNETKELLRLIRQNLI